MRQTLQKEQCLGQPRMVCTEAHIYFSGIHQVPARGQEFAAFDATAGIDPFGFAGKAIGDDFAPGEIAVAGDHSVRLAALEGLFRKQGGVNAAVDHPGAPAARHPAHGVAAQSIAGCTLMPTMSPGWMVSGTICSSDSSTRMGSPATRGVAAASTNSHRGVMTAVPKELSLGLTRWTRTEIQPFALQVRLA